MSVLKVKVTAEGGELMYERTWYCDVFLPEHWRPVTMGRYPLNRYITKSLLQAKLLERVENLNEPTEENRG